MVEEVSQLKNAIDVLSQQISDVKTSWMNLQSTRTSPPQIMQSDPTFSMPLINTQMSLTQSQNPNFLKLHYLDTEIAPEK